MSDNFYPNDPYFMDVALHYARRGLGSTFPNPSVGAVITKDNRLIAAGHTATGGRPHAEILALKQTGSLAEGATMFVTLEPCCHIGATPPCTEALIASKLARIVVATRDSNPQVAGRGIAQLQAAGIDITYGVREEEARRLNAGFFSVIEKQRPIITLKLATSLDGRIATHTGESQWITGPLARNYGHKLRAEHDAILVGSDTALDDNPSLTCRLPGLESRSPIRIVADSRLRLPLASQLVRTASQLPVWVLTRSAQAESTQAEQLRQHGVRVIAVEQDYTGRLDMKYAMRQLASAGITRVLLEGGSTLATSFMQAGLVDTVVWIRAPLLLGGDARPAIGGLMIDELAKAKRCTCTKRFTLGDDIVEEYAL